MALRKKELLHILAIDSRLKEIKDVDVLLEHILSEARAVMNADAGSVYVTTKERDRLTISHAQNKTLAAELPAGEKLIYRIFSFPVSNETISGYCAYTGKAVRVADVYNIPDKLPYRFSTDYDKLSGYRTKSVIAIPLLTNIGELLGVIQLINKKDALGEIISFNNEDEVLLTHFAANATTALQRAQMTRALLMRMIKMAELRDPKETGQHVNRVAGYSVEIYERWAHEQRLEEDEIRKAKDILRMAAMLHDVGKVAIADAILKKPGRFSAEEYETIKSHTLLGARLFADKQSNLDEVAQIVAMNHHENWDGSGYPGHVDPSSGKIIKASVDGKPLGKRGEEIPLFGRIVSISDVYDALRSRRVYKEAWSDERTLEEMRKMSGIKFDPYLLEIFFKVLPDIQAIAQKYVEEPKGQESEREN